MFFCSTLLHHFFLKNNDEKLKTKKTFECFRPQQSSSLLCCSMKKQVCEGRKLNITNKICHSRKGKFFEAVSSNCVENQDYDVILIILWCTTPGARTKLSSRSYKQPHKPAIYYVWKPYNFLIELESNGKSTGYL